MSLLANSSRWITNFGRNLRFAPRAVYTPQDEHELLSILEQVKGRKIRVVGRLHGWSRGIESDDVVIDLRHLNTVRTEQRGDSNWAVIGAGCQIKRALAELESQAGWTLPTVGLITEQSIAGACSTGTHGSGKHSISHYVDEIRIAGYDSRTGVAAIKTISDGPELRAARCSLGCMGVVVSVGLRCVPQYDIEDQWRHFKTLDEVLALEDEFPSQQFYFLPWLWEYYAQLRRVVPRQRRLHSLIYRWYTFLVFDIAFHLAVMVLARWIPRRSWIHVFFRWIAPATVIQHWKAVGKSQQMLTMEHELFRHIEIELFVPRQHLGPALDFLKSTQQYLDGHPTAIDGSLQERIQALGMWDQFQSMDGTYTHHYHTTIRRVRPDDTLISMASGVAEPCYALSLISYARPNQREKFFKFADFLAHSMAILFEARPHWGKYCPISGVEAERLYPELPQFRSVCRQYDARGVFRNDWVNQVLFSNEEPKSP